MHKCDHTNVNSRRAFPLNSRSSWVEQQHYKGSVVYRDNLVLGPAEYSPTNRHNSRHVGTPTLSQRSRVSLVDAFNPFGSKLSMATPGRVGGGAGHNSYSIVDDAQLLPGQAYFDRQESATIFHDHDRRMGTDPHRRFCPTPGASLPHDSLLLTRSISGISVPATVHFGPDDVPFGDRAGPVKPAGPCYSPDYDSKYNSKYVKLSKISPSARKTFADMDQLNALKRDQPDSPVIAKLRADARASSPPTSLLRANIKPSPVRMPILRTRKPPALSFDHSCYHAKALSTVELNPAAIDRLAKVGLFNSIMTTKRQYDSATLPSKISGKIRRSAL